MIAAIDGTQVAIIATAITALAGGVVALFKVRPEATRIVVDAAQGAVVVQSSVIESLRTEVTRIAREMADLHAQLDEVTDQRDLLRKQNSKLLRRVDDLEREVAVLKLNQRNGAP